MGLQDSLYFVFASGTAVTLVYHIGKRVWSVTKQTILHQPARETLIMNGSSPWREAKYKMMFSDFYWLLFSIFQWLIKYKQENTLNIVRINWRKKHSHIERDGLWNIINLVDTVVWKVVYVIKYLQMYEFIHTYLLRTMPVNLCSVSPHQRASDWSFRYSICALWYLLVCLNAFVTALILSKNCILNAMYKIRLVKNRLVNLKVV